jgi:hypothetical protein
MKRRPTANDVTERTRCNGRPAARSNLLCSRVTSHVHTPAKVRARACVCVHSEPGRSGGCHRCPLLLMLLLLLPLTLLRSPNVRSDEFPVPRTGTKRQLQPITTVSCGQRARSLSRAPRVGVDAWLLCELRAACGRLGRIAGLDACRNRLAGWNWPTNSIYSQIRRVNDEYLSNNATYLYVNGTGRPLSLPAPCDFTCQSVSLSRDDLHACRIVFCQNRVPRTHR